MKKALIVNTLEALGANLDEVMIGYAPRKHAPGKDEPQRLYATQFVYGEADGFILLGDASFFNPRLEDKDVRKIVLGWLPKNRLAIWNTREAVEWHHEATLKPEHRPH